MTSDQQLRFANAKEYHSYHGLQQRDTATTLKQYGGQMNWKECTKILDIGCGPGDLTANYLLPLIGDNGQITAADVSSNMISYAKTTYSDKRLKFEVMDITDRKQTEMHENEFDMIFSFYCLHWVQDQRSALQNIWSMLKTGGEFLGVFLAKNPIYNLFEMLSADTKWAPYMLDIENVISPYYHTDDPELQVRNLLENTGFHINHCNIKTSSYTFQNVDLLYKSLHAVNPFLKRIPENLLEEYFEDCKIKIKTGNLCSVCEKTNEATFSYKLIVILVTKIKN